ncbi:MAG: acid phosphatase [Burkholderiaceae bacterium]
MHRHLRLHPLTSAIAAAFLAAAAVPAVAKAPASTGVVLGVDGKVYAHAKVCVDRNHDARCDGNEPAAFSGADGAFRLPGHGALVAEVGKGAFLVDTATHAKVAVTRALVLRGPEVDDTGPRAVGPLSTELQAIVDAAGKDGSLADAEHQLRARLGLPETDAGTTGAASIDLLAGPRPQLVAEQEAVLPRIAAAVADTGRKDDLAAALASRLDLDRISTVVVIYAENRSFNNLFANFPGATGVPAARDAKKKGAPAFAPQKDRDGSVLAKLPPAWGGLTAAGQPVTVTQAQTTNVWPNAPFQIDAPAPAWGAPALPNTIITRDLVHRFYENQMQIDGGLNDKFAAWGDSGGVVMGWFDGSRTAMWKVARDYTLADRFFQGAFGGSYLNHQYLVCACLPEYPNADTAPAHPSIAVLKTDAAGKFLPELALADNSPASALTGPPVFRKSGNLTPKDYLGDGTFHSVNTMQPPYQPSYNPPAPDDTAGQYATAAEPTTLPPQTLATIGDLLTGKGVAWTWYAGGWNAALADRTKVYDDASGNFQAHHQPFNYYAAFDPKSHAAERAAHLKDYDDLVADAAAGKLPPVVFYKPVGRNNEHPGYASLAEGDAHLADTIARLQASPQWSHMLVVVTYDENGGQWDEVAPPRGDLVGPGTRIPAVIVSPFARRGFVDHTAYDTGSIVRFITHRWSLPVLPGLKLRDTSLEANGLPAMGDLTAALELRAR